MDRKLGKDYHVRKDLPEERERGNLGKDLYHRRKRGYVAKNTDKHPGGTASCHMGAGLFLWRTKCIWINDFFF